MRQLSRLLLRQKACFLGHIAELPNTSDTSSRYLFGPRLQPDVLRVTTLFAIHNDLPTCPRRCYRSLTLNLDEEVNSAHSSNR